MPHHFSDILQFVASQDDERNISQNMALLNIFIFPLSSKLIIQGTLSK